MNNNQGTTIAKLVDQLEANLKASEAGLECNWKPGSRAVAESGGEGEYIISYFKSMEDMPAYKVEAFETARDCAVEMVKISMSWNEIELEEE